MYNDDFYEQVDGVAMGSHFSLIVSNVYMKVFGHLAMAQAPFCPSQRFLYVDDTSLIWPHGGKFEGVSFIP